MLEALIGSVHYKERDVIAKGGANCSRNRLIILLYGAETKFVYFFIRPEKVPTYSGYNIFRINVQERVAEVQKTFNLSAA
jgi:hypothetical protein